MLETAERRTDRETKTDTFKRLAAQRTNAVLEKLRVLGNCGNRSLYEFTEDDARKIFRAIEAEVKRTKAKFTNTKKERFKL